MEFKKCLELRPRGLFLRCNTSGNRYLSGDIGEKVEFVRQSFINKYIFDVICKNVGMRYGIKSIKPVMLHRHGVNK